MLQKGGEWRSSKMSLLSHPCNLATVANCEPGTLVRDTERHGDGLFALVTMLPTDEKAFIKFEPAGPTFRALDDDAGSTSVLKFDGETTWDIDHLGPVSPSAVGLANMEGALVFFGGKLLLNVRNIAENKNRLWQYSLYDGMLTFADPFRTPRTSFGSWQLYLKNNEPVAAYLPVAQYTVTTAAE